MWENIALVLTAVIASSGFWAYLQNKSNRKDARLEMLMGLAHDRIIHVGKTYIERGWLTYDEYADFMKYLYEPYAKFGGNGLAEKIKNDVCTLPLRPNKDKDVYELQPRDTSNPDRSIG